MFDLLRKSKSTSKSAPPPSPRPGQDPLTDPVSDDLEAQQKGPSLRERAREMLYDAESATGLGTAFKRDGWVRYQWERAQKNLDGMQVPEAMRTHRPGMWKQAKTEFATENLAYFEATYGRDFDKAAVHARFLGPTAPEEVNVPQAAYRAGLNGDPRNNDWSRIEKTVVENITDTFSRYKVSDQALRAEFERGTQLTPPKQLKGPYSLREKLSMSVF